MKLTKNDFTGCSAVYKFTLKQLLRNKSNIVSLIITVLTMFLIIPGIRLMNDRAQNVANSYFDSENTNIPAVIYLENLTEFDISLENDPIFASSTLVPKSTDSSDSADSTSVKVWFNSEAMRYEIEVQADAEIKSSLETSIKSALDSAKIDKIGADKLDMLSKGINVGSYTIDEYAEKDDEFSMGNYYIQLIYTILVMMVSLYAAAYIVQSVVQEKTSKLVEILMISVKPLALILGKILAVMVFVFGLIAVNILAAVLGSVVSSAFMGGGGIGELLSGIGINLSELKLDAVTIIAAVFSLLLGYMTYSLISGLTGAGCSEQEDIQSANSTSIMIIMLCYIAALTFSNFESDVVKIIISLCPMLSVFCAPVQYMLGGIGLPVLVLSWLIQLGVIVFLALVCSKVYADLIIYRGKRKGLFDIIKSSFGGKSDKKQRKERAA